MPDIAVLCIDDESYIVDSIKDFISKDYRCLAYDDPIKALDFLRTNPIDILIVDYRMPIITGLDFLKEARKLGSYSGGLLLTAYADKDILKNALNHSLVAKVLEKPLNLPDLKMELDQLAGEITQKKDKQDKMGDIYRLLSSCEDSDFYFIGKDGDLSCLWQQAEQVAPTTESFLITGETGTGKDVLARQIHSLSGRADKPFIKINCGAIPAALIESELFGHEKGAFSGAEKRKFGKIELAHEGTLFLDEIGELPIELQSRLLHVVEDKSLERVGGTEKIQIDFRLICATNKPLNKLTQNDFRRDLYYRISTVHLKLPDLKTRKQDFPLHVLSLINRNCRLFGKPPLKITSEAVSFLSGHSWPGNIRELDNVLKRVVIMKTNGGNTLTEEDFHQFLVEKDGSFSMAITQTAKEMLSGAWSFDYVEKALLKEILELCGGRIMDAARKTGIPKDRFYRMREQETDERPAL